MAITGAIFNSLIFGNVNSADYGIYITGAGAFNAPERAVELVSIPGRNGAIAIDQGRYENIEVTYPAGVFGDDATDFRTRFAEFRNAMKSQIGYQRLTDTYNPNEYRMALFISAIEIDPVAQNKAGEFSIVFNCKPQRWLTSGETEVTITSGNTLTNPTANDASPLLMIRGYGDFTINGSNINIQNATLGNVALSEQETSTTRSLEVTYDKNLFNTGDQITAGAQTVAIRIRATSSNYNITGVTVATQAGSLTYTSQAEKISNLEWRVTFTLPQTVYSVGTRLDELVVIRITVDFTFTSSGVSSTTDITFQLERRHLSSGFRLSYISSSQGFRIVPEIIVLSSLSGVSTVSILGDPTYIDCDLGVCYKIENNQVIDLNPYIDLGSDLPILSSGDNEITFDNTITSVGIIPRWWQL